MNFVNSLVVNASGRTCRELTTVSINPNGIALTWGRARIPDAKSRLGSRDRGPGPRHVTSALLANLTDYTSADDVVAGYARRTSFQRPS